MTEARVKVSKEIPFPPERIYAVLADYRHGHPNILPRQYFTDLQVLSGGQGAGTRMQVRMRVMGVERKFQLAVAEPEPGRVLAESDAESGTYTTFHVETLGDRRARVTIASRFSVRSGPAGWMEKMVTETITRRIYKEELHLLENYLKAE